MKRSVGLILSLLLCVSAQAQDFDGYIVKLKEGKKLNTKAFTSSEEINTSFGQFVQLKGTQKSIELLKNNDAVEYVEPNYIVTIDDSLERAEKLVSDPKFSQQWGLKNTGKNSGGWWSPGKKGEDINAENAWKVSKGSKDVIVAVIDTGIDWRHADLKKNLWVNEEELNGEEGVDDDGNGVVDDLYGADFANNDGDPMDGHGHGTHCSGVIGASHDSVGIAGVMANVKLMGIKFLTDSGSGSTANAIKSVNYAIKMGAHVMSNSWGGGGKSEALKEAIVAANDQGIAFVAAAGNSRSDNDAKDTYPANYKVDNVISVGAMDGTGKKASFSNYGKKTVHVFAPGVNILSTVKAGGYKKMSGTSMACPHVSGIVGLLISNNKNLNPSDIKDRLMGTAIMSRSLNSYTVSGRTDAYRALTNRRN
ncbi:MAG: S8 family serine peptidase [Bacteriovoracaceae bacterium]|nr:S8 family serine peptidase [Bacteriovoracaceae bacterium]